MCFGYIHSLAYLNYETLTLTFHAFAGSILNMQYLHLVVLWFYYKVRHFCIIYHS